MPSKPIAELNQEELREYNRNAKARSRQGKPPEKDKRGYRKRDRAKYMREYRKAIKDDIVPQ